MPEVLRSKKGQVVVEYLLLLFMLLTTVILLNSLASVGHISLFAYFQRILAVVCLPIP